MPAGCSRRCCSRAPTAACTASIRPRPTPCCHRAKRRMCSLATRAARSTASTCTEGCGREARPRNIRRYDVTVNVPPSWQEENAAMTSIGTRQQVSETLARLGSLLLGHRGNGPRSLSVSLPRSACLAGTATLGAIGAGPALALDATGTWSGTFNCRQKAGARADRGAGIMLITQRGEALFFEIDG